MKNLTMLLLFLIVSSTTSLFAQAQPKKPDTLSTCISLQYGIGKFAVTDKYISGEKYSGTLPLLGKNMTPIFIYFPLSIEIQIKS